MTLLDVPRSRMRHYRFTPYIAAAGAFVVAFLTSQVFAGVAEIRAEAKEVLEGNIPISPASPGAPTANAPASKKVASRAALLTNGFLTGIGVQGGKWTFERFVEPGLEAAMTNAQSWPYLIVRELDDKTSAADHRVQTQYNLGFKRVAATYAGNAFLQKYHLGFSELHQSFSFKRSGDCECHFTGMMLLAGRHIGGEFHSDHGQKGTMDMTIEPATGLIQGKLSFEDDTAPSGFDVANAAVGSNLSTLQKVPVLADPTK